MLYCEFCQIFKNTFCKEHLQWLFLYLLKGVTSSHSIGRTSTCGGYDNINDNTLPLLLARISFNKMRKVCLFSCFAGYHNNNTKITSKPFCYHYLSVAIKFTTFQNKLLSISECKVLLSMRCF